MSGTAHGSQKSISGLHQAAVAALDQAASEQPTPTTETADKAVLAIVALRNALIERLRAEPEAETARAALDQVNAVLSLAAAMKYPFTAIPTGYIQQAGSALRAIAL